MVFCWTATFWIASCLVCKFCFLLRNLIDQRMFGLRIENGSSFVYSKIQCTRSIPPSFCGFHIKSKYVHNSLVLLFSNLNLRLRSIRTFWAKGLWEMRLCLVQENQTVCLQIVKQALPELSVVSMMCSQSSEWQAATSEKISFKDWPFSKWNSPYQGWVHVKLALKVRRLLQGLVELSTWQHLITESCDPAITKTSSQSPVQALGGCSGHCYSWTAGGSSSKYTRPLKNQTGLATRGQRSEPQEPVGHKVVIIPNGCRGSFCHRTVLPRPCFPWETTVETIKNQTEVLSR